MALVVERFQIYLVALDPTQGSEIRKTRPCIVVSPDPINRNLGTVIVAPMTTTTRNYPSRVAVSFKGKTGEVALDQIRAIDKSRLLKKVGVLQGRTAADVSAALVAMFSY